MSCRKHRLSPHFVGVCTHSLKSGHGTAERVGPCDVYSARDAVHVCFGAIGRLLVKGITRFSLLRSEVKAAGMHPIDVCQLAVTNTKAAKQKDKLFVFLDVQSVASCLYLQQYRQNSSDSAA